jgi:RNA polymerase sigma-70 factor (sigma-E family)
MVGIYSDGRGIGLVGERDTRNEVLHTWFEQHYASLHALARMMLGNQSEAEEVVMDAFAKALFRWRLFRGIDRPDFYLRRVVINECRSKLRRRKVEARALALVRPQEARLDTDVHAHRIAVWEAIAALPPRQRAAIALRYLDDLTEREIAEITDVPVGTVKSQLSRGKAKLLESLGERPDELD